MPRARILIIGNEVLAGEVADRNIHFLARRLTELGTRVHSVQVVADEDAAIIAPVRDSVLAGHRLLVTGGIGPTHDDRTRSAVAEALGRPLERHADAEARIRASYGPRVTPAELDMALLPRGARLVTGPRTGIAGFVADPVYVFPGVPDLLVDIFDAVAHEFAGTPDFRCEIVTRRKEGDFAADLALLAADFPQVRIGSYPVCRDGAWVVRLILRGADAGQVEAAAGRVRRLTGDA